MPDPRNSVPLGRIRRTIPLAGFTARAAGGRMVAALREKTGDSGAVARFHERTAEQYTQLLGHSKGVLMKAGQLLSMVNPSSLGSDELAAYQTALSRLQADAPPMDPALAKEVLRADLGQPVEKLFAEFTDQPVAAASIGQVHRAVLHDGRQVAVKIQYPGAAEAIRADLANTEMLASFFRFASSAARTPMPDAREAAREIAERISEEIDYRHEAANITRFNELYDGHPFIQVPKVIHEASGDAVLTMTFLDGMDWPSAQQADQHLKNTWAEVIYRFISGSYRHGSLFHADPHPGNYCFGTDGRVGFVDFGCVKVLPERQRRLLLEMERATVDGRREDLRNLMVQSGYLVEDSDLTTDEAYDWWAMLLEELLSPQPVTYTQAAQERAIKGMIDARSPDHPVRRLSVPNDFVFLSRVSLSMNAIFAELGVTLQVRSMADDMDGIAKPVTPLGKRHHAWLRTRGLPYGLEHHDDS